MNRREALSFLSQAAAGAGMISTGSGLADPSQNQTPQEQASRKGLAPVKIRDIKTILTAPEHTPGHRQSRDDRAGPAWLGMRHVHSARLRRPDCGREVSEAISDRSQRGRDRGHLAVVVYELVLAQRPIALQRDERRGHRAVGHQGQTREHAALSTARRQGSLRRRPLFPRQRTRFPAGRGKRAARDGDGLPLHPRAGRGTGPGDLRRARRYRRRRRTDNRSHRPDQPEPEQDLGIGPYVRMLPKLFDHLRTKLGEEVELLHDVHERVTLPQAIQLCKDIERHRLFFLEDPFPPEETIISGCCANRPRRRWRWANCSTRSTNTCR